MRTHGPVLGAPCSVLGAGCSVLGPGCSVLVLACLLLSTPALAQDPHAGHAMPAAGWTFIQDTNVFVMFDDQGSPRGEREVKAPNWWMGMARKNIGKGQLTLNLMLSPSPGGAIINSAAPTTRSSRR